MRMRARKAAPSAPGDPNKLGSVDPSLVELTEPYRGNERLRWTFKILEGKSRFEVAARCDCGAWWGWVEETRRQELLELVSSGCPACGVKSA